MILSSTMEVVFDVLIFAGLFCGIAAISVENSIPAIPAVILILAAFGFKACSDQDERIAYEVDYWQNEARTALVHDCPTDSSSAQCMLKWRDYREDSTWATDKFNKMMEEK